MPEWQVQAINRIDLPDFDLQNKHRRSKSELQNLSSFSIKKLKKRDLFEIDRHEKTLADSQFLLKGVPQAITSKDIPVLAKKNKQVFR